MPRAAFAGPGLERAPLHAMHPFLIRSGDLLRTALSFKYLPFTILVVLSVVSLLSRVILLLR